MTNRLKPSEVVVRVIDAPAFNTTLHPDAYGVTYVVRETNRGWLATVFSDRIDQAASRVGVEPGTLLGRVMAHEVGHLLLGSGYHGEAGLMRAEWPDALLARNGERVALLDARSRQDAPRARIDCGIVGRPPRSTLTNSILIRCDSDKVVASIA